MVRKKHIVSYTDEEIDALIAKQGTRTDWARVEKMTDEEVEAAAASDPEEADMVIDWDSASFEMPQPKAVLNMRIDRDVLEFFRKMGKGYQTRINAVLRSYVEQQTRRHHE